MSRRIKVLIGAGLVMAAMLPIIAIAGDRFNDVPDTNVFHDDIGWLADAGVTLGCNPPANDEFCPSSDVKREQMAAFMRRFAKYIDAEDGTPGMADHATTAGDADTLDGLDSTDFVGAGTILSSGVASNSKLGGTFTAVENVVGSVEITYPGPGVLFVSVEGYQDCPAGTLWQRILADNLGGDASFYLSTDMDGDFNNFSNQYTWGVDGAGTTTFSSSGFSDGGDCTGGGLGSIVAMYVPAAYGNIDSSPVTQPEVAAP